MELAGGDYIELLGLAVMTSIQIMEKQKYNLKSLMIVIETNYITKINNMKVQALEGYQAPFRLSTYLEFLILINIFHKEWCSQT